MENRETLLTIALVLVLIIATVDLDGNEDREIDSDALRDLLDEYFRDLSNNTTTTVNNYYYDHTTNSENQSSSDHYSESTSCLPDNSPFSAWRNAESPESNYVAATLDSGPSFYIADQGDSRIFMLDNNGTETELVTSVGINGDVISELELIGNHLYYVVSGGNTENNGVYSINLSGVLPVDHSTQTPFVTGDFYGITHDQAGNLYLSSRQNQDGSLGYISVINKTGSVVVQYWASVMGSWPILEIDSSDNVFLVESNSISQIDQNQVKTILVSNLSVPAGLTYSNGCLFYTDDQGVNSYNFTEETTHLEFSTSQTDSLDEPTRVLVEPEGTIYILYHDGLFITNLQID
jgi:hypothetical protein|tara:strand:- start:248 stop:1294 length:1047 start_codon:yes stop_codon:yes gene_type:complete